jgi:hypothetical protein
LAASHNIFTPSTNTTYTANYGGCNPPTFGDWTVTTSCTLFSSKIVQGNVIVQSGAVLTISNGVSIDIVDFTTKHLIVKSGGGVLIKAGGKIF